MSDMTPENPTSISPSSSEKPQSTANRLLRHLGSLGRLLAAGMVIGSTATQASFPHASLAHTESTRTPTPSSLEIKSPLGRMRGIKLASEPGREAQVETSVWFDTSAPTYVEACRTATYAGIPMGEGTTLDIKINFATAIDEQEAAKRVNMILAQQAASTIDEASIVPKTVVGLNVREQPTIQTVQLPKTLAEYDTNGGTPEIIEYLVSAMDKNQIYTEGSQNFPITLTILMADRGYQHLWSGGTIDMGRNGSHIVIFGTYFERTSTQAQINANKIVVHEIGNAIGLPDYQDDTIEPNDFQNNRTLSYSQPKTWTARSLASICKNLTPDPKREPVPTVKPGWQRKYVPQVPKNHSSN